MYQKLKKFLIRKKHQISQKRRVANFKKRILKSQRDMKKNEKKSSLVLPSS